MKRQKDSDYEGTKPKIPEAIWNHYEGGQRSEPDSSAESRIIMSYSSKVGVNDRNIWHVVLTKFCSQRAVI